MAKARPRCNALDTLTRSEAEIVIYEANLGTEDSKIAHLYLIEKLPQLDIAMELNVDRKTISKHITKMLPKLQHAADKFAT